MKNVSLAVIITIILMCMPQTFVFAAEPAQAVWIEAEQEANIKGEYRASSGKDYSDGALLLLDSTNESIPHQADFEININATDTYDIWVLSSVGNQNYVSTFKWNLNGEGYKPCPGASVLAFRTSDARNVPLYWHKLSEKKALSSGINKLSFLTEKKRTMENDFLYNALDVIAVVPSSWQWVPSGKGKPFDKEKLKLEFVAGKVDKTHVNAEESFSVTFTNKVIEKTDASPSLFAMLAYKGQTVSKEIIAPSNPVSRWKVGNSYTNMCSITVPFNVPDGDYEVYAGIEGAGYVDREIAKIADIKIGEEKKAVVLNNIEITELTLPDEITIGETVKGSSVISLHKSEGLNTAAYLTFWKDDILWYVSEIGRVDIGKVTLGENHEIPVEFIVKDNIPKGNYTVKFALHKTDSIGEGENVSVVSHDEDRYYKPLANGVLNSKKTGSYHFWYVNQNNTLIWDGEPYIPMGAMYCSDYITNFRVNNHTANKKNWEKDMEVLRLLREKGVVDIYINSVSSGTNTPAWAWQVFIDKLEELGFVYGLQLNGGTQAGKQRDVEAFFVRANEDGVTIKAENVNSSGIVKVETASSFIYGSVYSVSCAYIAVDNETGEAVDSGYGTGELPSGGKLSFSADVKIGNNRTCTVFFTPLIKQSVNFFTNMWDAGDVTKKLIGDLTSKLEAGDNLRTVIDPIYNEQGFINWYESMRFVSPNYDDMFAEWLSTKYDSIDSLNEAWKIEPLLTSFEQAVRILPLHTGKKGGVRENLSYAFDVKTKELYTINIRNGIMWDDSLIFRDKMYLDFSNDVADVVKEGLNVPVVYKHTSYINRYFISDRQSGGFDGLGSEAYGVYDTVRSKLGFSHSEAKQFAKTCWLTVTETQTEENITKKNEIGLIGYPSKEYMFGHFDTLIDSGARGIWDFLMYASHDPRMKVYSYVEKPESFEWLKEYRGNLLKSDNVNYLKENGPVIAPYYIYPAGQVWWFQPNKRNAAIYDDDYQSTRAIILKDNTMVEHTFDPSVDTAVLFVTLEDKPATTIWGPKISEELNSKPKGKKIVFLGLRKDLGSIEEIDKYYTSEMIDVEEGETVQILNPPATAKILYTTQDGKPWGFAYDDIYIIANSKWNNAKDLVDDTQESPMRFVDSLGFVNKRQEKIVTKTSLSGFVDVDGHWASAEIKALAGASIVYGVNGGYFLPDANVSRAEFLAMLFRGLKMRLHTFDDCYDDITADKWYADVIQTAKNIMLIDSGMLLGNSFIPEAYINRQEMASIISIAYGKATESKIEGKEGKRFVDDTIISPWAAEYVKAASTLGIINGMPDGSYGPFLNATRAEAVVIIKRFLDNI